MICFSYTGKRLAGAERQAALAVERITGRRASDTDGLNCTYDGLAARIEMPH